MGVRWSMGLGGPGDPWGPQGPYYISHCVTGRQPGHSHIPISRAPSGARDSAFPGPLLMHVIWSSRAPLEPSGARKSVTPVTPSPGHCLDLSLDTHIDELLAFFQNVNKSLFMFTKCKQT